MIKNIFTNAKLMVFFAISLSIILCACSPDTLTYEGTVQNVNLQNSTFTLVTPTSQTVILTVNDQTKIKLGGKSATLASMQVGSEVVAKVDRSDNITISVSDMQPVIVSPIPSP